MKAGNYSRPFPVKYCKTVLRFSFLGTRVRVLEIIEEKRTRRLRRAETNQTASEQTPRLDFSDRIVSHFSDDFLA